ncbi:MAG: calcium-binding protein, partial [Deltaproteobacteria bacterium]|nr:calcium-binding protein [Deltaproteobacteria bacterium]
DDELSGGGGSDTIVGHGGDDTITVGGNDGKAFTTTVDGGSGNNTLIIDYPEVSSLGDFVSRTVNADGTSTLVDANGGTVHFKNISSLIVGSVTYSRSSTGRVYQSDDGYVYMFNTNSTGGTFTSRPSGRVYNESELDRDSLDVVGSNGNDTVDLRTILRDHDATQGYHDEFYGSFNDTVSTLDGDDSIRLSGGMGTVDAGEGNDSVTVDAASLGQSLYVTGGDGRDTLLFSTSSYRHLYTSLVDFNLNETNEFIGFEDVVGTNYSDSIVGDEKDNELSGRGDKDTLLGSGGNDTLYGETGEDKLLGGTGADTLDGGDGNDHLDGGIGADTLTGGDGTDTFILRAGDGGSSLSDADVFTDFKAGEDVLGLDRSLRYSDLVITQGEAGNSADTVIKTTSGEYLAILKNTTATDISATNFTALSDDPICHTGTYLDDVIIGAAGDDELSGGGGSDTIVGHGGDDTITVGGNDGKAFTTTVDGGSGNNTLII